MHPDRAQLNALLTKHRPPQGAVVRINTTAGSILVSYDNTSGEDAIDNYLSEQPCPDLIDALVVTGTHVRRYGSNEHPLSGCA